MKIFHHEFTIILFNILNDHWLTWVSPGIPPGSFKEIPPMIPSSISLIQSKVLPKISPGILLTIFSENFSGFSTEFPA